MAQTSPEIIGVIMASQSVPEPEAGVNPEPAEGWGSNLTEYERRYIGAFGSRPQRDGWLTDGDTHAGLDGQAATLLRESAPGPLARENPTARHESRRDLRARKNTKHKLSWLETVVIVVPLVAAGAFATFGTRDLMETHRIEESRDHLKRLLDELQ